MSDDHNAAGPGHSDRAHTPNAPSAPKPSNRTAGVGQSAGSEPMTNGPRRDPEWETAAATDLVARGLTSATAESWLAALPAAEALVPTLSVHALEASEEGPT